MKLKYEIHAHQGEAIVEGETPHEDGAVYVHISHGSDGESYTFDRGHVLWLANELQTLAIAMERGSGRPKTGAAEMPK